MTVEEMVQVLIDKGHSREYAEFQAPYDYDDLRVDDAGTQECSVCRGHFTPLQMKYHYHPCE